MVHFPGFARTRLWIHRAVVGFCPTGFPHSDIPGSKPACGSPRLIAACHVLHRLLLPRHPPCALSSLTIKFTQRTFHPEAEEAPAQIPWQCWIAARQRGRSKALQKIYVASCRLPVYSVVKHRPRRPCGRAPPPEQGRHRCPRFDARQHAWRPTSDRIKEARVARSARKKRRARGRSPRSFARHKAKRLAQDDTENLVELTGFEPVTPCLQSRCSPS